MYNILEEGLKNMIEFKGSISEETKNSDINFVDAVYKIKEKYNMDEKFNYEEFYLNKQLQLNISNDIRWFINELNNDYSFSHNYETSEFEK